MAASSGSIRLHALDNLRAALMWLGIVLHVSVNHTTGPALLPFRDGATTLLADMLLMFIHAFRMPAFFVLAGFLAALMVADRGHVAMFRNRVRRIALPFAVFWPLLFTAMVLLVLLWAHLMRFGTFGLDVSLAPKPNPGRATINTMHMWFIYYLFIFCAMAALACSVSRRVPQLTRAVNRLTDTLALNWWGVLMLAAPLAMIGSLYPNGIVVPDGSFLPNVRELVHNGLFFIFGWTVFRHRAVLLARFADRCWLYALAGTVGYKRSAALPVR